MNHFDKLRALMGYVENGTDVVISIFQDDATMDYAVTAKEGSNPIWSENSSRLEDAIDQAYEKYAEKFEDD